jgi:acylphosphatase
MWRAPRVDYAGSALRHAPELDVASPCQEGPARGLCHFARARSASIAVTWVGSLGGPASSDCEIAFRYATAQRARSRDVARWVRNNPDGTVAAVFEGAPDGVDALIAWCRSGPAGARVDDVRMEVEAPSGERGFWAG